MEGSVLFDPWYIDEECTTTSDEVEGQGVADAMGMGDVAEAPEPSITMFAGDVTIEEGMIILPVEVENNGAAFEGAIYGITLNLLDVAENITALSASCNGEAFKLTRADGDTFTGYFGLSDGFTIDEDQAATVPFTIDLGDLVLTDALTVTIDAWVGSLSAPDEAVAQMEQVQFIIPAAAETVMEDGVRKRDRGG